MVFEDIEMDPIWLLDLRRAGIPYVWQWGTSSNAWRYAEATRMDLLGRVHTVLDLRSKTHSPVELSNAMKQFKDFQFSESLIEAAYLQANEASAQLGTPLMA